LDTQDSEYIKDNEVPYISCWIALDDMSEDNGTLYVVPYPNSNSNSTPKVTTIEDYIKHHTQSSNLYKDKAYYELNSEDNIDSGQEIPILGKSSQMCIKVNHNSVISVRDLIQL
jgi:hypothetical protein